MLRRWIISISWSLSLLLGVVLVAMGTVKSVHGITMPGNPGAVEFGIGTLIIGISAFIFPVLVKHKLLVFN